MGLFFFFLEPGCKFFSALLKAGGRGESYFSEMGLQQWRILIGQMAVVLSVVIHSSRLDVETRSYHRHVIDITRYSYRLTISMTTIIFAVCANAPKNPDNQFGMMIISELKRVSCIFLQFVFRFLLYNCGPQGGVFRRLFPSASTNVPMYVCWMDAFFYMSCHKYVKWPSCYCLKEKDYWSPEHN